MRRDDRRLTVEVLAEHPPFSIEETARRIPHVPTAREAEDQKKYSWSRPRPWDLEPSGVLTLKVEESRMAPIRKTWADGKRHRVEYLLTKAVAGMVLVAEALKRDRLERERQHREWEEAQQRRLEEERRQQEEEARRRDLHAEVERWVLTRQVRAYLEAAEAEAVKQGRHSLPEFLQWLQWAQRYATLSTRWHWPLAIEALYTQVNEEVKDFKELARVLRMGVSS
jgi:hypothetical protein